MAIVCAEGIEVPAVVLVLSEELVDALMSLTTVHDLMEVLDER